MLTARVFPYTTLFRSAEAAPAGDPLEAETEAPKEMRLTFRDFFPYERSPDGTRARVGWRDHYQGIRLATRRSEEHKSELQSLRQLVCRLLRQKKSQVE